MLRRKWRMIVAIVVPWMFGSYWGDDIGGYNGLIFTYAVILVGAYVLIRYWALSRSQ